MEVAGYGTVILEFGKLPVHQNGSSILDPKDRKYQKGVEKVQII